MNENLNTKIENNNFINKTNAIKDPEGNIIEHAKYLDSLPINDLTNLNQQSEAVEQISNYISLKQAEVEKKLSENIKKMVEVAFGSNTKLNALQEKMATQWNPKTYSTESEIFAHYLVEMVPLLTGPIHEIASYINLKKDLLGLSIASREQGYIDYEEVFYKTRPEKLPVVASMFYAEFPTDQFGTYAKKCIEEFKNNDREPIGRSVK